MSSWREQASAAAQRDLDELLSAAIGFAQQQIADRGSFFPYAAAIDSDGRTEMIAARSAEAGEHPDVHTVIAACLAALRERRSGIRAGAIVTDIRLADTGGDAIEVDLEHADGPALAVFLPYSKRRFRKGAEFGELRAQAGTKRIWTES